MAASSMSQPPQFLSEVGDPIILWKRWKPLFDSYLLAICGEKFSAVRKQAVLLHNLGVEGWHIYDSLDEMELGRGEGEPDNVYDMSVMMLEKHFGSIWCLSDTNSFPESKGSMKRLVIMLHP